MTEFGADLNDPRTVSRDEVKVALNDGLDDLSMFTSFHETYRNLRVVGDSIYHYTPTALGEDILYVTRVQNLQSKFWLEAESQLAMDSRVYSLWEQSYGEPSTVIPLNLHWFGVHPRRTDSNGKMRVYAVALHPHMVNDYDTPDFPEDYHRGLVEYGIAELHILDSEIELAAPHLNRYAEIRDRLAKLVNNRFGKDRVAGLVGTR